MANFSERFGLLESIKVTLRTLTVIKKYPIISINHFASVLIMCLLYWQIINNRPFAGGKVCSTTAGGT